VLELHGKNKMLNIMFCISFYNLRILDIHRFVFLICFSSGKVIVHALDEKAREYYNLEGLWATETSQKETNQVI
jgi:hypothetical protein